MYGISGERRRTGTGFQIMLLVLMFPVWIVFTAASVLIDVFFGKILACFRSLLYN
ncbi:hypothetical protein EV209_1091 [Cuneatibacter caecimuris]|uniref:Uncharacterized protein n=1 Tax=Cuneatibacter caecimuris TaxID=1796618 RepID=A0A4Q7PPL3_9FIRM|nr:hypothetical protein EV209_1091 [Cuneatibacter caecimuris]